MSNALANEKSRYLRQHGENPVDWHPWKPEVFDRAAAENKPLFVSIGYSSCHWCHVMAHESFEDPEIASVINENFLPIKVDKEELPDVDSFYMEFLTRLSGHGGWPLNVFINPNRAPFYGMSYVPKRQLTDLLTYVRGEYDKNEEIHNQTIDGVFAVQQIGGEKVKELIADIDLPSPARPQGPQFPQGTYLSFALQRGEQAMVSEELEKLVLRGLFDHIEGGWFRYSVDPDWTIPHFEKMLYDQAALLYLCAQAYSMAPKLCSYAITKTVDWLETHMKLPNGLYGSATDADTSEGEGAYYTLEPPQEEGARRLFRTDLCGVHEQRILPWLDWGLFQEDEEAANELMAHHRSRRATRVSPELDPKAVFSWNAFLGYSLLACAGVMEDDRLAGLGRTLQENLVRFTGSRVPHVVYEEESCGGSEYLQDYSALLWLLSALPENERKIDHEGLIRTIQGRFVRQGYLFHTTEPRFENISLWQDTPFPCGGAMLLSALLNLGRSELEGLDGLGIAEVAAKNPSFFALWCAGFDRAHNRRRE